MNDSIGRMARVLFVVVGCVSVAHAGTIRISSPDENSVFNPGQTISVTVEGVNNTVIKKVAVMAPPISEIPDVREYPP